MASAETQDLNAQVTPFMRHFESMKAERRNYEWKWQLVNDYIMTMGRDFSVTQRPNILRKRRATSVVAPNANDRLAAFLLAYLIDPTRPFLLPNVKRGLAAAGRPTNLDDASLDYLGDVATQIFDHLLLPKARLMLRLNAGLKEFCAFGSMVIWTGRKRGFGPVFQTRPVQACWWSENEEGEIDTLYYKALIPVWRVLQRWPNAAEIDGWDTDKAKNEQDYTPIIFAVEPRQGGVRGAVAVNKPFKYVVIAEEKKRIIEETGYDSFPYGVARYDAQPGQTYSYGIGCKVLPEVMVLNHVVQNLEQAIDLIGNPVLAMPERLFGKRFDRRPGAVMTYNSMGLGLQSADKAIWKLDIAGDPKIPADHVQYLTNNIELAYFTDWMRLRDSGDMTAEEVNDRRDMRLRGMSSIVSTLEPLMGSVGDRSLEILNQEGLVSPPPPQLSKTEVDWEYSGPLQVAQLRGQVQSLLQLANAAGLVRQQDPAAAEAVDLEETLRGIADGLGAPPTTLNSRAKVKAAREQMQQQAAQAQTAAKLQAVAGAAKDGAGAISQISGAANDAQAAQGGAGMPPGMPPGMGAGGAGFAPAAPFAGPVTGAAA